MKEKTDIRDLTNSEYNSRLYGKIGDDLFFGNRADVRWVNVWGKVGYNVYLEEGSKILGDE